MHSAAEQDTGGREALKMWRYERKLVGTAKRYAGVDEAGRGCIAGPVFAAAVVLGGKSKDWVGVADSKTLSKTKRESLFTYILSNAKAVGIGTAGVGEIETYNILHASRLAMARAVYQLESHLPHLPDEGFFVPHHLQHVGTVSDPGVEMLLVDGPYSPWFLETPEISSVPVVDGDALCLSVAAASIVAKVSRDRYMEEMAEAYPHYGFEQNAGYGTRQHLAALKEWGITPIHRTSFAPVQALLQTELKLDG